MKTPGKGRIRLIPLLLSILLTGAVVAGLFLGFRYVIQKRQAARFSELSREAADLLAQGFDSQALQLIRTLQKNTDTSERYLILLKMLGDLSSRTGDYREFLELAERGSEAFPGRQELTAMKVYGLLRTGGYEKAARESRLLSDLRWNSLRTEALLRSRNFAPEKTGDQAVAAADPEEPDSGDPYLRAVSAPEPQILETAGEQTGVPAFYLDAALLYAGAGDVGRAQRLASRFLEDLYPRFSLLISIDAGRDQEALALLQGLEGEAEPYLRLVRGDILLRQEQYPRAGEFYRQFVLEDPAESWVPWYNLALLSGRYPGILPGNPEEYLREGLGRFPGQEELTLALARELAENSREEQAEALLEELIRGEESHPRAELRLLRLIAGKRSPGYLMGKYWELFGRYPEEPVITRSFAEYLLGWGQWEDLTLLLNRCEAVSGSLAWITEYRALAAALQGRGEEAMELLEAARAAGDPDPVLSYNTAVVYAAWGRRSRAEELLREAESLIPPEGSGEDRRFRGRIRILLGEYYLLDGNLPAAARELNYGLELDPGNLRGQFARKQLNFQSGR